MLGKEKTTAEQLSWIQFLRKLFNICLSAPPPVKRSFIINVTFFGTAAVFNALIPIFSAHLLNALQKSLSESVISAILICWTVAFILSCHFADWFLSSAESLMSVVFFRYNTLFCQIKTMDFFKMPALVSSSDFRQKAISVIPRIGRLGENLIYTFIWFLYQNLRLICSSVLLIAFMPLTAIGIFCLSALNTFFHIWINNKLKSTLTARLDAETQAFSACQDALENANNIRMLGLEKSTWEDLQNQYDAFHTLNQRYKVKRILAELLPTTINIINYMIVIWIAIHIAFQEKNIGVYVMLTGLAFDVLTAMNQVIMRFKWLHMNGIEYMNLDETMQYDHSLVPIYGKSTVPQHADIHLQNVVFSYPQEKHPVLDKLSLNIKAGTRTVIIGNSGMGKSTLINIIQHAYEIQSGSVKIGNKNIRSLSKTSLHQNITFIDQHPTFWNQKNIKENMLIFAPKATDEQINQALKQANLLDEIIKKEKGLNSKVTSLSAGQKQRLALARALLRNTPIIIMDEPTANLDTQAQNKVLDGIKNLSHKSGGKSTIIFASNVPAEIATANRILLLENGKIIEDGSPKKLMSDETSKTYHRLKKYKSLFIN